MDLSKLSDVVKNEVVKKVVYNAKIKDITDKNKTPYITNLATIATLTAVENKIPNVSNLVKKTDYNTKVSEIENKITTDHDHNKYITKEFDKLTSENLTARLKQANLASKSDVANFVKNAVFDIKVKNVTSNKNELNELLKKLK